jgi:hypothetical protein
MPADGVDKDEGEENAPAGTHGRRAHELHKPNLLPPHGPTLKKRNAMALQRSGTPSRTGIRDQLSTALSAYKVRTGKEKERRAHVTEKPFRPRV